MKPTNISKYRTFHAKNNFIDILKGKSNCELPLVVPLYHKKGEVPFNHDHYTLEHNLIQYPFREHLPPPEDWSIFDCKSHDQVILYRHNSHIFSIFILDTNVHAIFRENADILDFYIVNVRLEEGSEYILAIVVNGRTRFYKFVNEARFIFEISFVVVQMMESEDLYSFVAEIFVNGHHELFLLRYPNRQVKCVRLFCEKELEMEIESCVLKGLNGVKEPGNVDIEKQIDEKGNLESLNKLKDSDSAKENGLLQVNIDIKECDVLQEQKDGIKGIDNLKDCDDLKERDVLKEQKDGIKDIDNIKDCEDLKVRDSIENKENTIKDIDNYKDYEDLKEKDGIKDIDNIKDQDDLKVRDSIKNKENTIKDIDNLKDQDYLQYLAVNLKDRIKLKERDFINNIKTNNALETKNEIQNKKTSTKNNIKSEIKIQNNFQASIESYSQQNKNILNPKKEKYKLKNNTEKNNKQTSSVIEPKTRTNINRIQNLNMFDSKYQEKVNRKDNSLKKDGVKLKNIGKDNYKYNLFLAKEDLRDKKKGVFYNKLRMENEQVPRFYIPLNSGSNTNNLFEYDTDLPFNYDFNLINNDCEYNDIKCIGFKDTISKEYNNACKTIKYNDNIDVLKRSALEENKNSDLKQNIDLNTRLKKDNDIKNAIFKECNSASVTLNLYDNAKTFLLKENGSIKTLFDDNIKTSSLKKSVNISETLNFKDCGDNKMLFDDSYKTPISKENGGIKMLIDDTPKTIVLKESENAKTPISKENGGIKMLIDDTPKTIVLKESENAKTPISKENGGIKMFFDNNIKTSILKERENTHKTLNFKECSIQNLLPNIKSKSNKKNTLQPEETNTNHKTTKLSIKDNTNQTPYNVKKTIFSINSKNDIYMRHKNFIYNCNDLRHKTTGHSIYKLENPDIYITIEQTETQCTINLVKSINLHNISKNIFLQEDCKIKIVGNTVLAYNTHAIMSFLINKNNCIEKISEIRVSDVVGNKNLIGVDVILSEKTIKVFYFCNELGYNDNIKNRVVNTSSVKDKICVCGGLKYIGNVGEMKNECCECRNLVLENNCGSIIDKTKLYSDKIFVDEKCIDSICNKYGKKKHDNNENIISQDSNNDSISLNNNENLILEDSNNALKSYDNNKKLIFRDSNNDSISLNNNENLILQDSNNDSISLNNNENIKFQDSNNDSISLNNNENIILQDSNNALKSYDNNKKLKFRDSNNDSISLNNNENIILQDFNNALKSYDNNKKLILQDSNKEKFTDSIDKRKINIPQPSKLSMQTKPSINTNTEKKDIIHKINEQAINIISNKQNKKVFAQSSVINKNINQNLCRKNMDADVFNIKLKNACVEKSQKEICIERRDSVSKGSNDVLKARQAIADNNKSNGSASKLSNNKLNVCVSKESGVTSERKGTIAVNNKSNKTNDILKTKNIIAGNKSNEGICKKSHDILLDNSKKKVINKSNENINKKTNEIHKSNPDKNKKSNEKTNKKLKDIDKSQGRIIIYKKRNTKSDDLNRYKNTKNINNNSKEKINGNIKDTSKEKINKNINDTSKEKINGNINNTILEKNNMNNHSTKEKNTENTDNNLKEKINGNVNNTILEKNNGNINNTNPKKRTTENTNNNIKEKINMNNHSTKERTTKNTNNSSIQKINNDIINRSINNNTKPKTKKNHNLRSTNSNYSKKQERDHKLRLEIKSVLKNKDIIDKLSGSNICKSKDKKSKSNIKNFVISGDKGVADKNKMAVKYENMKVYNDDEYDFVNEMKSLFLSKMKNEDVELDSNDDNDIEVKKELSNKDENVDLDSNDDNSIEDKNEDMNIVKGLNENSKDDNAIEDKNEDMNIKKVLNENSIEIKKELSNKDEYKELDSNDDNSIEDKNEDMNIKKVLNENSKDENSIEVKNEDMNIKKVLNENSIDNNKAFECINNEESLYESTIIINEDTNNYIKEEVINEQEDFSGSQIIQLFDKKLENTSNLEKSNNSNIIEDHIQSNEKNNEHSSSTNMKINILPPNFDQIMNNDNQYTQNKSHADLKAENSSDGIDDLRKIVERLTIKIDQDRMENEHVNKQKFKKLLEVISEHLNSHIMDTVQNVIKKEVKIGILGIKKGISDSLFTIENKIAKLVKEIKEDSETKRKVSNENYNINDNLIKKELKNMFIEMILPKMEAAIEEMKRQIISSIKFTNIKQNNHINQNDIQECIQNIVSIKDDIIDLINNGKISDASAMIMDCTDDIYNIYITYMLSEDGKNIKNLNTTFMLYMLKRSITIINNLQNESQLNDELNTSKNNVEFIRAILIEIEIHDLEYDQLHEFSQVLKEIQNIEISNDLKNIVKIHQTYAKKLLERKKI